MRASHEGTPPDERFEIRGHLGSGGFGTVYEAFDRRSEQRVALKELTRASPGSLSRFKKEFRSLADIHHPNLVRLKELIERERGWYIVMDLIEGDELLDYVRRASNDPGFDESRLRAAFIGVAEGLEALHGHGILHRDLKPSNVRVTAEGRAVLLDFGLVTAVDEERQSTHAAAVGTVAYMAPEQAKGDKLGPATDWYAFGASLYEALTGRRPFLAETALLIALEKQRSLPPHPATLVSGLPADLSDLCMRLLRIEADARPKGSEALDVLRGGTHRHTVSPTPSMLPIAQFAGREEELSQLGRALARTRANELRIVLVEGESGVGKSELVAEFLRREQEREPRTLALRGRCYENEQASYKAFDTCIDELAGTLRRMGRRAVHLLPAHAPLLAQLFPSFSEVTVMPRGALDGVSVDPTARRLQGFSALAALLRNLAVERPLIVVMDDLQWADGESFRLLRALVEDDARPPILVLATVRPRDELEGEARVSLDMVRALRCTEVVSIVGLPQPTATALARTLLGAGHDPAWAAAIAQESRGHPLLLAELAHFAKSGQPGSRGVLTLEAALTARIERLPGTMRELLEVIALAGRPYPAQVFSRALAQASIDEPLTTLLGHKLLRMRQEQIGCYHDQIRRVGVSLISPERRISLHRRLAEALATQRGLDPSDEAAHWDLAGDAGRAREGYERAARQAFAALAFGHAERMFARAMALSPEPRGPGYASLVAERARTLDYAGRSAEAAATYAAAAELCADPRQRLVLRSRMAVKLLQSGNLQAGLEACRVLLGQLGVRLPRSELWSIVLAYWHRLRTRFPAGSPPRPRPIDDDTRLLLDLLPAHISTLAIVSAPGFLVLSAQFARLAMRIGDRASMRQAYAFEGWLRNAAEGWRKAQAFFAAGRELVEDKPGLESIRAYEAYAEGAVQLSNYRWKPARALLTEAERLHVRHCPEEPWVLIGARYTLGLALYRLGEHALLARKMDEWIHEAEERQDRFAVALLSGLGHGAMRHVMRGSAQQALAEVEGSFAHVPAEPFTFAHLGHVLTTTQILVLEGGRAAWDRLEERRAMHGRAFLLKTRTGRAVLLMMRTVAALSAAVEASAAERRTLLGIVHEHARRLRGMKEPFTDGVAAMYEAQAHVLEQNAAEALRLLGMARAELEPLGYAGVWAVRYLQAFIEGGADAAARSAEVLAFFEGQGWLNPVAAIRMSAPIVPASGAR